MIDKKVKDLLFYLILPFLYLYVGIVWLYYKITGKKFPTVE